MQWMVLDSSLSAELSGKETRNSIGTLPPTPSRDASSGDILNQLKREMGIVMEMAKVMNFQKEKNFNALFVKDLTQHDIEYKSTTGRVSE